jgi:hypothetical protein
MRRNVKRKTIKDENNSDQIKSGYKSLNLKMYGMWGFGGTKMFQGISLLPHSARRKDLSYPKGIKGWAKEWYYIH